MEMAHTVTIVIVLKNELQQKSSIMECFLYLKVYYQVSSFKCYANVDVENIVRFKQHIPNLNLPSEILVSQMRDVNILAHENSTMNLSTSRESEILLTQL